MESIILITQKRVAIWGTGNTSDLYQKCFERENLQIEFYLDNNADKLGQVYSAHKVICPNDIQQYADRENIILLVCSGNENVNQSIIKQIESMGYEGYPVDLYLFAKHLDEIIEVIEMLEDERSRNVYYHMIMSRCNNTPIDMEMVDDNQYFCIQQFMRLEPKEVFVDIGAYVGDSLEEYIWKKHGVLKKTMCIEPDTKNIVAMNTRIERLIKEWGISEERIQVLQIGIGEKRGFFMLDELSSGVNGLGSKFVSENDARGVKREILTLDNLLTEKEDYFIKADIESFEYGMILGGRNVISEFKPKMAICIYHNASDMYQIPLLIKKINPEYKVVIRHHSIEYCETVMYVY